MTAAVGPRFTVESWSPEYGAPVEPMGPEKLSQVSVDIEVERSAGEWRPIDPPETPPARVIFVDGVRRIDARIWIEQEPGLPPRQGLCASCAAGTLLCSDRATVGRVQVERSLITSAPTFAVQAAGHEYGPRAVAGDMIEDLTEGLRQCLRDLEIQVAGVASGGDLIVIDGPLRGRDQLEGASGYIKSHRVEYLPEEVRPIVSALGSGQRTPLFVTQTTWSRYCWYLRLPGGSGHPWAGVVRCELAATLSTEEAIQRCSLISAALPRFASASHKDPRAPQNLYPIAGLERELRRQLGDQQLLYRRLCAASH